ncbi:MAG: hypothetical protein ACE5I2_10050 [Anaerolineae bacterium]
MPKPPEIKDAGTPSSRTPQPYPGPTPPFNEWVKQEQAELEQIHADHLARLKADEPVRRHYAAITEKYKKEHLAKHKAYARTSSSSRSKL